MVAITVILAAVIAAFVFGMAGTTGKTKNLAATAVQTNATFGYVTYQGGADNSTLSSLTITSVNGTANTFTAPIQVGKTFSLEDLTSGQDHIIVAAKFSDGGEQVILDTNI